MLWRLANGTQSRVRCTTNISYLLHAPALGRQFSTQARLNGPSIAEILALQPVAEGQQSPTITIQGSVRTIRNQKRRSFVELGDGSTIKSLQAVLEPSQCSGLSTGTSVEISGSWETSLPGKEQSHELKASDVRVIGPTEPETYPIQKKYQSAEYLRSIPHLRLRTPFNALLTRLRSHCDFHFAQYFHRHGFIRVHPPVITSSDCEGAGEVFSVDSRKVFEGQNNNVSSSNLSRSFFRTPRYLTVSSQLHLEAFVHEHQKLWTFSPTFRAEKSDTPRHVSEFWMLEVEIRTRCLSDVMDVVEDLIRSLASDLELSPLGTELLEAQSPRASGGIEKKVAGADKIRQRWLGLGSKLWPRITFADALLHLQKAVENEEIVFQNAPSARSGFQLEHEKFIADKFGQGRPVFVTDYPWKVKPFYMLPSQVEEPAVLSERSTVACFDLLLPDMCEVVGGSLREHRLQPLLRSMRRQNLQSRVQVTPETPKGLHHGDELGSLEWYVDLRRYGSVPHGGFGLGFDRLIGYLAGVDNIRDVVPWPRYFQRCDG